MVDILSLVIGIIVAAILAVAIYTQRDRISQLRLSFLQGAASTRSRLSKAVDTRYREAIIKFANGMHVAGHLVPLEQVAVLPRFVTPPDPFDPLVDEPEGYNGPLTLIPFVPDWPQAYGAYQVPGLTVEKVLRGEDNMVLLGLPGSGRSAALALMAVLAARQIEDNQPGGITEIARVPILFHVADLDLSPNSWSPNADPLGPMLAAAGIQLQVLAEQYLNAVQGQFAAGYGLILADGWDELTPKAQREVTEWLRVLISTYPGNKLVVAASSIGYKPLQDIGLAPIHMMPWGQSDFVELGNLWASAWPEIGGRPKQPATPPDQESVRRAVRGNRGRSPLDATLKVWAAFAGDDPGIGRRGWYSAYINRVLTAPELKSAMERIGERDLATSDETGLSMEEVTALIDAAKSTAGGRVTIGTADFIYSITGEVRLLAQRATKRLTFVQPAISAYLAAEALKDVPLYAQLLDGRYISEVVLSFLSQMRDISQYVQQRMAARPGVTAEEVLSLALWATDADPSAPWRGDVFKRLALMMLSPSEFPSARERAMAALSATRDNNVGFIFRQGLKNESPRVRMLSAYGLGSLGDSETVTALGEALADEDPVVQIAVALGLGAMGTKPAMEFLIQALLTGIEMSRRAAAEMLAITNMVGEGYDLLKEAVQEQDAMTRRAAVLALQLVKEDWAKTTLEEAQIRDDQWLVRAAAETALNARDAGMASLPKCRPGPEKAEWLTRWLADRDENVSAGTAGVMQLVRALQDGDDPTRLAAAEALGALAPLDSVTPLYSALRDAHAEVRDAAYRALISTSLLLGRRLPGVA